MTEIGQGVDFAPLKTPDYVGDYNNAFQVGRALQGQRIQGNALQAYGENPGAPRPTAVHALDAMTPAERSAAANRADILGHVAVGLKGRVYDERPSLLTHLTPALAAHGVPPEALAAFDPSDTNLDDVIASTRDLFARLTSRQPQGGERTQTGDGNENPEEPGRNGLNVGDAEVLR